MALVGGKMPNIEEQVKAWFFYRYANGELLNLREFDERTRSEIVRTIIQDRQDGVALDENMDVIQTQGASSRIDEGLTIFEKEDLEAMNVARLRVHAEKRNIDHKGKNAGQLIKAILKWQAGMDPNTVEDEKDSSDS